MASSDARPYPLKNVAYRHTFEILDADGDPVTGAAGLDSEVSKDGAAFADCTNEATEIGNGAYYIDLTSTEMNADTVVLVVKTSTAGAKQRVIPLYPSELGDWVQVADDTLGRSTSAHETAASEAWRTLYGVICALTSKRDRDGTDANIRVYKSDDSTLLVTIPITKEPTLQPIQSIDPP